MIYFLGDINDFDVFPLWILRLLLLLKLNSQWLQLNSCFETLGTKGAVAGLIEAYP